MSFQWILNSTSPIALAGQAGSVSTPADGPTITLNAALGSVFFISALGDRTLAPPDNPGNGQKIVIEHYANSGARTLTLDGSAGGFRFGSDITALSVTASGKTDYIGCIYNSHDGFWDVIGYVKGF